jgi:hypothetical protein
MTEELSGRRIVVPETRQLGRLVRMLKERGAEAIPGPMIAIGDAPDAESVEAWLLPYSRRSPPHPFVGIALGSDDVARPSPRSKRKS